jgi:hypothetical protein
MGALFNASLIFTMIFTIMFTIMFTIAGYLSKDKNFDKAIANFAMTNADQTERDYQLLVEAVDSGQLVAAKSI